MHRLTRGAIAIIVGVLLTTLLTSPTAQARTTCQDWDHYGTSATAGVTSYHASFWFKWCETPRKGPDKLTIKPMSGNANYHTDHYGKHPTRWCTPFGDLSRYVVTFRVWNPATAYDHSRELKVDCDGGENSDVRPLTNMPRCPVPAVLVSQGRGGDKYRREWCRVSIRVERVYTGPDLNHHDWIKKRAKLTR